ncbi:MAG TPA: OmpH family outer membrane protein [Rariglobus sp.]|jgi:outer membrane protein|nr:OmpH family outer membrane protein [Rariglobus sp.]
MHKLIKSCLALAVAGVFTAAVQAQPAPKIFVVDMVKLYDGHFKTEEQNAKLKSDQQKAEDELQKMNGDGNALVKQAQDIQEQIKNPTLSNEAKAKAQQDLQAKAEEIQKKQNEVNSFRVNTQRALQQRINTFKQLLLEEISKTAVEIAKKKGATLLIDKSGPSLIGISSLIYSDPAYDITDDVAKEINKDRPAASTAPAAAASGSAAGSDSAPSVSFPGAKK